MKTTPWFSTEPNDSLNKEAIHHDNTTCEVGKTVPKNNLRYGTDNRPLCPRCARLNEAGR